MNGEPRLRVVGIAELQIQFALLRDAEASRYCAGNARGGVVLAM